MIRLSFIFLFAFAVLSSFGADYMVIWTPSVGYLYSYTYDPSASDDSMGSAFGLPSDTVFQPWGDIESPSGDYLGSVYGWYPDSDSMLEDYGSPSYVPSDPAYADFPVAPAVDPLIGGGGGSPSGGDGEGVFDPVGSFGGLPSFMSGLASVALGLFGVASAACISFLVFRKVRYSSKRL